MESVNPGPSTASGILRVIEQMRLFNRVDALNSFLEDLKNIHAPLVISFVNAHAVNLAWKDAAFCSHLAASDVLLRDGIGVKICLMAFGRESGLNLIGTDLIPQLLTKYRGRTVALFGTRSPYLEGASRVIEERYGNRVICLLDGFQPDCEYIDRSQQDRPELIVLAMGMPKQERVSMLLRERLKHPCLIVNGGAIVDYLAGRFPRAPVWVRRIGCEWLFRLAIEPERLWKRYLIGNVTFLFRMLALRLRT